MGIRTTGPVVKNHISIQRTSIRCPWFINEFPYDAHTNFFIILIFDASRYTENPVCERSGSTSEELRGNLLHKPTEIEKNKNEGREEVQSYLLHELPDWLQEFRENLVDERSPLEPRKTRGMDIETLPVFLMNYPWSREQTWNQVRVSIVSIRTFRRTQIATSA